MSRVSTITTAIRADDLEEFKAYLLAKGFTDVSVFEVHNTLTLSVYFANPVDAMTFRLRGIEESYKALRSKEYFYDLHDTWDDDETRNFFGNEDH